MEKNVKGGLNMKYNFKKIGSVLASAVMIGSTAAIAAAASYPGPYASGGSSGVAIVVGSAAAPSDFTAATNIGANLNAAIAASTEATGPVTVSGGDSLSLEKSSTKFHIGNGMLDVISSTVTDDSPNGGLPTLLAEGVYIDDDNDEFDYTQKLTIINHTLTMFEDSDYQEDEPVLGIKVASNANILNYTLDFTDNPEWADLDTSDMMFLGKEYYVLSHTTNTTMTLLDSATTVTLGEGDSKTVSVGGESYTVSINFIGTSSVKLDVNGQVTNSLNQGDTQKISGGAYVGIKDISVQDYAGGVKNVEFSIGKGKLKLTNNTEVELNDDNVPGLTAEFESSSEKLQKLRLIWKANDDEFAAPGSSITMPGFEAVKISFGGMIYPKEETIEVKQGSSTYIQLENFPLKDSVEDIPLVYTSDNVNFTGIGKGAGDLLATTNTSVLIFDSDTDDQFIVTWDDGNDAESYLMKATNFKRSGTNDVVTFQYRKDGVWTDAKTDAKLNDVVTRGNAEFTLTHVNDTSNNLSISAGSNVNFNTLYSKEGLKLFLPFNASAATDGISASTTGHLNFNASATNPTFNISILEEDKNENKASGKPINIVVGFDTSSPQEVQVTAVHGGGGTSTEIQDTDVFRNFVYSDLGTEILYDQPSGNQNSVKLVYHGDETYGQIFISSPDAVISGGSGGNVVPVYDTENVGGKNLIVVGGSCINTVAAELLGSSSPLCGSDFTSSTGVGAGQFMIETFSRSGGKMATLVAGYNAADTTAGASALTSKTPEVDVGDKYVGDSSGSLAKQ